jgi:hypothetical protein
LSIIDGNPVGESFRRDYYTGSPYRMGCSIYFPLLHRRTRELH